MLESTFEHLADDRQNIHGELTDGVIPILFPPSTQVSVIGRPGRRLTSAFKQHITPLDDTAAVDRDHQQINDDSVFLTKGIPSRRDPAATGTGRILIDHGRRFPSASHRELVIELRGSRLIEARAGGFEPPAPLWSRRGWWRTRNTPRQVARAITAWLRHLRHRSWAVLHVPGGDATLVPGHLAQAFASAGCDVDGLHLTIHDRRPHRTQKVLVVLGPAAETPTMIAKVQRDPRDGHRIENEVKALRQVTEIPSIAAATPGLLAEGRIGESPFVLQRFVAGEPLASLLGRPGSRGWQCLDRVGQWTLDMGLATVRQGERQEWAVLEGLVQRFTASVDPQGRLARTLADDAARLAAAACPVVLMHGDLGTWNILVTPDDRLTVIDWEAAEPNGVPLWDLFYLMATAASVMDHQSPGARLEPLLLGDGPLNRSTRELVRATVDQLGIPVDAIGPLFRLCWLHRAVKEARRLRAIDPGRGYANLTLHMASISDTRLRRALLG